MGLGPHRAAFIEERVTARSKETMVVRGILVDKIEGKFNQCLMVGYFQVEYTCKDILAAMVICPQ